jgi:phosphotriesterase-related protein
MKKVFAYLLVVSGLFVNGCREVSRDMVMTVRGPLPSSELGIALTHEHILVDFIGADSISEERWDKAFVEARIGPYLDSVKITGCSTFIDATPEYIGRDPLLLKKISESSGLHIITNTGYYGAAANKYMPRHAWDESAEELASRWTGEWVYGIGETGIKPGFIKIGVARDSLSELHRKIVRAAAITHLNTGLVIASHTGPALPAFQQIDMLKSMGVDPSAFIWVHAQNEKDLSEHARAARMGAWVSLDGIGAGNIPAYVDMLKNMKDMGLLGRVLLSHDAGWYDPAVENGGDIRGYTDLFRYLLPALRDEGFSDDEIEQLTVRNPALAFSIKIRKSEV